MKKSLPILKNVILSSSARFTTNNTLKSTALTSSKPTGKIIRFFVFVVLFLMINRLCKAQGKIDGITLKSGTAQELNDVIFLNKDTGIIVGGNWGGVTGTIWRTEDGGSTWIEQDIPTNATLNRVFFTDDKNGTAVGYSGTILRSTDSGKTWSKQTSGTSSMLLGVWFTDDTTGYAVGGWPGCILKTTDAGTAWNPLSHPEIPNGLLGVCFANSMHGWAVGYDSTIIHTTDGGNTWTKQNYVVFSESQTFLESVFCTDTNTAWIVGGNGTILHTDDGGETWIRQSSGQYQGMFDIFFINADTGYVVGGSCEGCTGDPTGYILQTTSGGNSWTTLTKPDTVMGFYGVFFADKKRGTVVGSDGTIFRTTDGGENWTQHEWPQDPPNNMEVSELINRIYPNPASDFLNIDMGNMGKKGLKIEIISVTGEVIYSEKLSTFVSSTHTVDLSAFEAGIYLIRVSNNDYSVTEKIVKVE
jgi:photosystem II stability/assembly factor-like uncharacterized protein